MPRNAVWVALALFVAVGLCDLTTHTYKSGDEVILFANTVGPFQNPQETYNYYSLPYCPPKNKEEKSEGLGEALLGYELVKSEVSINFKTDVQHSVICQKKLTSNEADKFQDAILKQYWYQLFLDDLPIWGMVGEKLEDAGGSHRYFLYTHKKFSISYNGDRVIEVNLTSENPVPVAKDTELEFTYSVIWSPTDVPFDHRFEKYLDFNFFEHQIHWFSILNSSMMVIFLVGLVSIILMRTLRKDFARYSREEDPDDMGGDVGDESGWKQVHGDVFRAPAQLMVFSALVGTGVQLISLVFFVLFFAIIGAYYETRGSMVTALVVGYSLTSFIGGYYTGGYYTRNGGKGWTRAMLVQSFLFPGFSFLLLLCFDFIAVLYGSVSAISIGAITSLVLIYLFVSFPLSLAGTILGKNWSGVADNPCRINPVPHQIPEKKWYLHPLVHIVLGGILPFGSIFIEMYFIFTSLWHYKYYYVYGFMLLVYIILIIVSVCVTIVSTYFLLNSEDYRWHWVSYLSSASTAAYVFLYSVYYFFVNTKMSGFFQTVYYFGYMTMFCFGMALLCGAIGFIGTSIFVRKIYQNVKID